MAKDDKQVLGILPTTLFKSWHERLLVIQQKSIGSCAFPLDKNEKVPTNIPLPIIEQISY